MIVHVSGGHEDAEELVWLLASLLFYPWLVVSVKCMLNAYVIEMLFVQVLYMIRELAEARVYFIALVLSLSWLHNTC